MKLISMSDFVLEQKLKPYWTSSTIFNYADFLKQPLKLEMFIGDEAIFIFQWEFKEWDQSDVDNSIVEDLISDDLDYVLNEKGLKQIGI